MSVKLKEILDQIKVDVSRIENIDQVIERITSKIENSQESDLVVYNLKRSKESLDLFFKRLKKSNCKNVIVPIDLHLEGINTIVSSSFFHNKENYSKICDLIFGKMNGIKIIGITGTNGKSTTVHFLNQLANMSGVKSASLGTVGLYIDNDRVRVSLLTTPDYFELRETLLFLQRQDVKNLFLEASSHALEQGRFQDIIFESSGWTNLSHDHLDYHGTLENYYDAKIKIIKQTKEKGVVFVSYDSKDLFKRIIKSAQGSRVQIRESKMATLGANGPAFLKATFNLSNLSLAVDILQSMGISIQDKFFDSIKPPMGRFSIHAFKGEVIVDYAHTPDGLEKILTEVKKIFFPKKIILIFGCGGNRDKIKRPIMGKIADKFSDKIIITNDNPRDEDPMCIANDIISGLTHKKHVVILDRKKAIQDTVLNMSESDVIVIAGKGHEDYQEISGKRFHFNDEEILLQMKENNGLH